MVGQATFFDEVIKIAEDYFGPAAPRVMQRLAANHLHKDPNEVTRADIDHMLQWTTLAVSAVTEDKKIIDEFSKRIGSLTEKSAR